MGYGILAGITWALETVIIGIALGMSPFIATEQAVFLAPFVSTFIHDLFSAAWAAIYNGARGNLKNVWKALNRKGGKFVALAAVIGGPVGMTGYVMSINYMGASVGAVYGLSYSPELNISNFWLGVCGTLMCAFGWGIEAVVLAKCMQDPEVKDEYALQIRQTTSALVYGVVLLPILKGWGFTASLFAGGTGWLIPVIIVAAFFATVSYLCYYRAIATIGASKAMALNVTYAAWAIVFTVVILKDTSVLTPTTVICSLIVIVCGIFAAADFKELLSKER